MKKMFYILFLALPLMFAGCDNGKSDNVYDYTDDYGNDSENSQESEVSDNDSDRQGHSDNDVPRPGAGTGGGNGNHGGSDGDGNSNLPDDEDGNQDFDDEDIEDPDGNENDEEPDGNNDDGAVYASLPDVESCISGNPSDKEKQKVLDRLNELRAIHGLPAVVYSTEGDKITAECSLIIAANNIEGGTLQLSHEPPKSWDCWSQEAYDGCHSSNIHVSWAKNQDISTTDSAAIVDGFMIDKNVDSIGHRRWFLDPWLGHISFGRADYTDGNGIFVIGAAVKVVHDDKPNVSDLKIDFVAYPFENYPKELYPGSNIRMSFSVLKDKSNKFSNASGINLGGVAIAIIDSTNNKTISVSSLKTDTDGIGIPNNVSWLASGIEYNRKYNVTVRNIIIDNVSKDYQYWFELK